MKSFLSIEPQRTYFHYWTCRQKSVDKPLSPTLQTNDYLPQPYSDHLKRSKANLAKTQLLR